MDDDAKQFHWLTARMRTNLRFRNVRPRLARSRHRYPLAAPAHDIYNKVEAGKCATSTLQMSKIKASGIGTLQSSCFQSKIPRCRIIPERASSQYHLSTSCWESELGVIKWFWQRLFLQICSTLPNLIKHGVRKITLPKRGHDAHGDLIGTFGSPTHF